MEAATVVLRPYPEERERAAEEHLRRGHCYIGELRSLLLQRLLLGDSWWETAINLVDELLHAIDTARVALNCPAAGAAAPVPAATTTLLSGGSLSGSSVEASGGDHGSSGESRKRARRSTKTLKMEQPYYDGHEWRKYGQKTISGCDFPKEYFRCAYKDRGCEAAKQVQKMSEGREQPVYMVKLIGEHTCGAAGTGPAFVAAGDFPESQHVLSFRPWKRPKRELSEEGERRLVENVAVFTDGPGEVEQPQSPHIDYDIFADLLADMEWFLDS